MDSQIRRPQAELKIVAPASLNLYLKHVIQTRYNCAGDLVYVTAGDNTVCMNARFWQRKCRKQEYFKGKFVVEPERDRNEEEIQFPEIWIHKADVHESRKTTSNLKLGIVASRIENAVLSFEEG